MCEQRDYGILLQGSGSKPRRVISGDPRLPGHREETD